MPDSCCAPGCQNRRQNQNDKAFYRIPKDPERRNRWISAIQRVNLQPTAYTRLCSDHFISGKKSDNPMSPDYVPSIFEHIPSPEKMRRKMRLETFERRQKSRLQRIEQAKRVPACSSHLTPDSQDAVPDEESAENESTHRETDNEPGPDDGGNPETPPCCSEDCKKHIQTLNLECQALRAENMFLKEKIDRTALTETSLQNNDKKVNLLTGLATYSLLMTIFSVVAAYLKPKSSLTCFQQYMLTLFKLRMNLSFDFLAYYFAVDSRTVSKLFKHCVNVMYCRLVPSLVIWPDRESLRKSLPYSFRNSNFRNTVCIIDCFEIFMEKPSNLLASAQCYSTYKSHHTIKYLIAICPQGSISFISTGWGGRTSDKFITEQSGFLSKLLPGDLVLADRGFNIRESIDSFQAELKIPAFTRGKKQLDPIDLESTRCLASLRIHIERVIGVLRQKYIVLQSTVPIAFTDIDRENEMTYLDKIVQVCCALTNASPSVVPFE